MLLGREVAEKQESQSVHQLAVLEAENKKLKLELDQLRQMVVGGLYAAIEDMNAADLPYDTQADAEADIVRGRRQSEQNKTILMVTFGANWCADCRNLHKSLKDDEVASYIENTFEIVNVDIGEFDKNRDLAEELGVSLDMGVPVAAFFGPAGKAIGNTNSGELDQARLYTSSQILRFVRDVAERGRIIRPDEI